MTASLYLITPIIASVADLPPLERAIRNGSIASAWLRIAPGDERTRLALAKEAVALFQNAGVAALVDAKDARFAVRCGADGVHLAYSPPIPDDALRLRPERILGFGGLTGRDAAMEAGELGDYVMFGEPSAASFPSSLDVTIELCAWWAALFETPCIGYAPDVASIPRIAATGAEFVALGPWIFDSEAAEAVSSAHAALRAA
jgi:thiamine-phosphate pyrophosphorylase